MQILYGFSNATGKTYRRLTEHSPVAVLQPDQKYHSLFIKGLAANGVTVRCFSGLPVNREVTRKLFLCEKEEQEGNAFYHYYRTVNLPLLRQIGIFCGAFFSVLAVKKTDTTYAVCDCLNLANAYGMVLGCKLRRIPLTTIVTDLPDMMYGGATKKLGNLFFSSADGFILLTEQMNARVNKKGKPHLVLEGHSNAEDKLLPAEESYESATGKKVILYAGSVQKLYGILNLAEAFVAAGLPDTELHIYGDGDAREDLIALAKEHPGVRYLGIADNETVVREEHRAALLVNPRPTAPEYTKYSFPSKNMEYMVSGTPVLTTDLPGMPEEYRPYVYLAGEGSREEIEKALLHIFSLPAEERRQKGRDARAFVLSEKTNVVQAKKTIGFLKQTAKGGATV